MARYHLFKGTRGYAGHAYCGPSNAGQPAEADTLEVAMEIRGMLSSGIEKETSHGP